MTIQRNSITKYLELFVSKYYNDLIYDKDVEESNQIIFGHKYYCQKYINDYLNYIFDEWKDKFALANDNSDDKKNNDIDTISAMLNSIDYNNTYVKKNIQHIKDLFPDTLLASAADRTVVEKTLFLLNDVADVAEAESILIRLANIILSQEDSSFPFSTEKYFKTFTRISRDLNRSYEWHNLKSNSTLVQKSFQFDFSEEEKLVLFNLFFNNEFKNCESNKYKYLLKESKKLNKEIELKDFTAIIETEALNQHSLLNSTPSPFPYTFSFYSSSHISLLNYLSYFKNNIKNSTSKKIVEKLIEYELGEEIVLNYNDILFIKKIEKLIENCSNAISVELGYMFSDTFKKNINYKSEFNNSKSNNKFNMLLNKFKNNSLSSLNPENSDKSLIIVLYIILSDDLLNITKRELAKGSEITSFFARYLLIELCDILISENEIEERSVIIMLHSIFDTIVYDIKEKDNNFYVKLNYCADKEICILLNDSFGTTNDSIAVFNNYISYDDTYIYYNVQKFVESNPNIFSLVQYSADNPVFLKTDNVKTSSVEESHTNPHSKSLRELMDTAKGKASK